VVAREDQHEVGLLAVDEVDVLVDGVGGAAVPHLADAVLRRDAVEELAGLVVEDLPALQQVLVQRVGLVLRQHVDAAQAGVPDVAEREVDDAVVGAERHAGLGAFVGQRPQPLAAAPAMIIVRVWRGRSRILTGVSVLLPTLMFPQAAVEIS
jgi:hypothetical protein